MTTLRLLSENSADTAVITVANTAVGMGAEYLKTDIRGEVCRVLSNTATITLDWTALTTVGVVVLPISNLGPSSTIRVRGYLDSAGTTLLEDTGVKFAVPGAILENWDFSQQLNVNAFTDGHLPISAIYFSQQQAVRKLVVDIEDPDTSFIDISRLVVGGFTEFYYGASYGASVSTLDFTKNSRAASGDSKSEWGPKAGMLTFDLEWVAPADRAKVRQIIARGIGHNMFFSLLPQHEDPVLERDYSIYGKVSQPSSLSFSFFNMHSTQFKVESF